MAIKIPIVTTFDNKGLKNAQTAIGKIGAGISGAFKVAAGVTAAVGALTTIGVAFAKAGEQAATSNARITQIAESMQLFGTQTGAVSQRLQDLAKATALNTGADINSIKATQAKLLTFRNLAQTADETGGAFDRATAAAVDLAAAGFGEAETNAVQLGKALQDPIKGITALARSGVTFTDVEKEKIRTLTESGKILEAQDMILQAIETQVGGTAEATANASDKMAQAFQIMKEDVGTALLPLFEQITQLISTALMPIAEALTPIFVKLFEALIPIVEKALPIFVNLLELISPILDTLLTALEPLLQALSPLLDVFELLLIELQPLIEQIMPIFIELVRILAPIVAKLVEALIPIVVQLLPPLLKLFESLIPIINILADYLMNYLLPVFSKLIEWALPWLIGLIEILTSGFEWLHSILGPVYAAIKPVLDALLGIAGIKPGALDKTVTMTVNTAYNSTEARNMAAYVFGGASAPKISTQVSATVGGAGGRGSATSSIPAAIKEMVSSHSEAANLEKEILDKRVSAFESFYNSVKQIFTQIKDSILSSFNLPTLGSSINSITRNIAKLLERTRNFNKSISQLSGMGLDTTLLQQIISMGPMAGAKFAQNLVAGGAGAISSINDSFKEFGVLSGQIAQTGTQSAFSGQTQQNIYNINVNGGVGSGPTIGQAIVEAIKAYERTSGAVWQGA
jgi:hypothetical protein